MFFSSLGLGLCHGGRSLSFGWPSAQPAFRWSVEPGIGIEDFSASCHADGADDQAIGGADHVHVPVVLVAERTGDIPESRVFRGCGSHPEMLTTAASEMVRSGLALQQ
jgi:hypothetical protein